ncbi:MAG: hypothetical protein AAF152_06415 [Cyanobacteria bacterium P01_A01_bin.114]
MIDLSNQRSSRHPKTPRKFLRLHPLTWLSVGLHGALLLMPAWQLQPPKTEEPEPPEEEVVIEVENLADLLGSQESEPPPAEPPPAEPPPAAQVPQQQVLTEVPEEIPEELLEPTLPEAPLPDDPLPDEPPPPPFDPAVQAAFKSDLSHFLSTGASNSAGTSSNFDNTDQWPILPSMIDSRIGDQAAFFTPDSIADGTYQAYPGVEFKYIGRNFDLVSSEGLGPAVQASGLSFEQIDTYGGSTLYVVISPEGNPMNYISLVDMKGSTAVFVWPDDPRQG